MVTYSWARTNYHGGNSTTTTLVSELFGLTEQSFREIPVLSAVPLPRTGITYVTGYSGTGKSKLLELFRQCNPDAWEPVEPADDRPLIELFELPIADVLALLGRVGLGEAFTFLTPYRQLSDGQRARARLALAYAQCKRLLVIDEFLSTVDRTSAAIAAYGFQKFCRRHGIAAVLASAHDDLTEALGPDLQITLDHNGAKTVQERPTGHAVKPFQDELVLRTGTVADYEALSRFHYMGGLEVPEDVFDIDVHVAEIRGAVAGVHVLSAPYPRRWERHRLFAMVNEALTISRRTVVHPTFRGIGVAGMLCNPDLARRDRVFGRSALQRFQPFMLGADYRRVEVAQSIVTGLSTAVAEVTERVDSSGGRQRLTDDERAELAPLLVRRAVELLVMEYAQYREIGQLPPPSDNERRQLCGWFGKCVDVLTFDQVWAAVDGFAMAGFVGEKTSTRVPVPARTAS